MDKIRSLKLWLFFFLYTAAVSAFVQIVLLPYILPNLHAGNGLLNSSYDSIAFHHIAVDLANKIRIQGWSAWGLRPAGQGPASIASIFYFFIWPDPRIFIPFQAAFHASAALILVKLLNLFMKNRTKVILCVLPFLVFPSNLLWTAQVHKDSYSILGVFLILYSMVSLSIHKNLRNSNWYLIILRSIIFYITGVLLIWIVRPYMLSIIEPIVGLFVVLLFLTFLIGIFKKKMSWQKTMLILLSVLLTFFILTPIKTNLNFADLKESISVSGSEEAPIVVVKEEAKVAVVRDEVRRKISKPITKIIQVKRKKVKQNYDIENHWKRSLWIPSFIENKLYVLAQIRRGYRLSYVAAKSNLDLDIGFNSVKSILLYVPRAAQIAFLAPFPNQWFGDASCAANLLLRKISILEMVVIYFALLFLPYAIWYWRKRIEIWIIFIFCVYMILVHGLVICNVGTLYRMRYPYITILVALGVAGFIVFREWQKIKREERRNKRAIK